MRRTHLALPSRRRARRHQWGRRRQPRKPSISPEDRMEKADFVVVGSSGGGGTIAWLLAKAGFSVVVLEQGSDWATTLSELPEDVPSGPTPKRFNPVTHDEYRFRLERPELKRHPRGDYNTFRETAQTQAKPFAAGWTGSML